MIIICTRDAALVETCRQLAGGREKTGRLAEVGQLPQLNAKADDLLIIDLKTFKVADLPELRCPAVALAEVPDYKQAMRLQRRGVRGYGNRHMLLANLKQAVAAVRAGQVWMPPAIITQMISSISPAEPESGQPLPLEELSKREREVADLVAQGLSNQEIADKLFISVRTVKAHLTSIFSKTGCRDRLELAVGMKNRNLVSA